MTLSMLLTVVVTLIVIGLVYWLVETWIGEFIPRKIRVTIYAIVCVCVLLWLLNTLFGVALPGLKTGGG